MSSTSRCAVVLGANGRFGQAAVHAFAEAGWRVLAQSRRPLDFVPPHATERLAIALDDGAALAAAATGAQVVVHAVNPPYTAWREQAVPLARLGLDLAERLGARFMLPGNVYNFGRTMPATLLESSPQRADTVKGRLRCQIEEEMRERARHGLASAVIRAGDFFGGGSGSWFDLVIAKGLARGRLAYPGPLDRVHAWAYLPDLARAFVALAEQPATGFETLHFAGHAITGAELLGAIERAAAALGLRPARGWRYGGMPWALIRAGSLFVPMWRELAEMAYLWEVPHALDGQALARRVGPLPAAALDQAVHQSLLALGFGHGRLGGASTAAVA